MSNQALFAALGHPALRFVNFTAFNRPINHLAFVVLIQQVQAGHIRVRSTSRIPAGADAAYDPSCNTIFTPFMGFGGTASHDATFVHESTHAILDIYAGRDSSGRRRAMLVRDDEVMGYLAGALYLIGRNAAADGAATAPGRVAYSIATAKVGRNPSTPPTDLVHFTQRELMPLQRAIANHPRYSADAMTPAHHDGVSQRGQCVI